MIIINKLPQKIGIFDSGIGGISILNKLLQSHVSDFLYVADTAYLPYGNKSAKLLQKRSKMITQFFISQKITTIVIACHTSSATTLCFLKKNFPQVTFIDMIPPTINQACIVSENKKVGLIATHATIKTHAHKKYLHKINSNIMLYEQPCPLLVPMIESPLITKDTPKDEIQ